MNDTHETLNGWEHMHPHDLRGRRVMVRTENGTVIDGALEVADVTPRCQITSLNVRDTNIYVVRCWRNGDDTWDNEPEAKLSVTIFKERP